MENFSIVILTPLFSHQQYKRQIKFKKVFNCWPKNNKFEVELAFGIKMVKKIRKENENNFQKICKRSKTRRPRRLYVFRNEYLLFYPINRRPYEENIFSATFSQQISGKKSEGHIKNCHGKLLKNKSSESTINSKSCHSCINSMHTTQVVLSSKVVMVVWEFNTSIA